jgi:hypothetical protein
MKKIKFLLPILVVSLGLINISFAQEKSSQIPPFTLVEAKLPQRAQYVIAKKPFMMNVCDTGFLKDIVFTLIDFKEEEGKISLNLVVKNNTKNEFPLVSGYEVLGEPELKPFNVYLISNTGEFYQASNVTQSIKLKPYETRNINLEFEGASTENYLFLLFNVYPKEMLIGCPVFYTLVGPFYLPGTKYLVPNKTVSYKTNQSFSPDNLEEFLRFDVSKFTGYRRGGFAMNISVSLIRERNTGEGDYSFRFSIFEIPTRKREAEKKYFEGYLIDNNGNFYLALPRNFYNRSLSVNSYKNGKKTDFNTLLILPNLIDGAEEFTLYLNADSEKYDNSYYASEIKRSSKYFEPLVEIEGIKVPEQITKYYSK